MRLASFLPLSVIVAALLAGGTLSAYAQTASPTAPVSASPAYSFGSIKPSVLADDPRLSAKIVQYTNMRLPVAELLEQFTLQTGVALEARDDQWDDSGRWRVACCLRDAVTVADAMDALRSALSLKGATWNWKRTGDAPNYQYRLVRPLSYEALMDANQKLVQDDFRAQIEQAKRGITMTPEQLTEAAKSDKVDVLNGMAKYAHTREGLKAFLTDLSPIQQEKAIVGGRVRIPLVEAGDATRTFAENQRREMNGWNPGHTVELESVDFESDQMSCKYTPSLFIMLWNTTGVAHGNAYVGGAPAERRMHKIFDAQAIVDGDAETPRTPGLSNEKIQLPAKSDAPGDTDARQAEQIYRHDAETYFAQLAKAESPRLNFVACLGQRNVYNASLPELPGKTIAELREYLKDLCILSKWRGDILTLRYTAGFSNDDSLTNVAPYPLYKMFRDRLNTYAKQRQIPFADMVEMTSCATEAQITGLHEEYNEAFVFLHTGQLFNRWTGRPTYPVFKELSTRPDLVQQLESEKGAFVGDLTLALHDLLAIPKGTPATARVTFRQAGRKTTVMPTGYAIFGAFTLSPPAPTDKPIELLTFRYTVPQSWEMLPRLRKLNYFTGGTRNGEPIFSE